MLADWATVEANAKQTGGNSKAERQNKYHSYNSFESFFIANSLCFLA